MSSTGHPSASSPSYIYIALLKQYEIHAFAFTILLDPKVLKELSHKYEMLITCYILNL